MSDLPPLSPLDSHNRTLLSRVHPEDWTNPEPPDRYNLVVVGAGTAGLITAAVAAGLGASVALVERHFLGGDCLNVGCVPSKALIRAARMVAEARRAASELGLALAPGAEPDFGAVMERVRRVRAQIAADDSAARYRDELGVDVYLGDARFTGRDRVEVRGQTLRFRKAVVATGARAIALPIEGLEAAGYLTNETIFNLTERPARLGIIGAGPIGCEMAQAFQRLGSRVSVLHQDAHILPREDADAARIVEARLRQEGVELVNGCEILEVEIHGEEKRIRYRSREGGEAEVAVDAVLLGVGRAPNVEGLGLEQAGIEFDPRQGVEVDDFLQTTNPDVFAAGDICMRWKFTHAADAAAKIVVRNALFSVGGLGRGKLSSLVMPWCTYTDPEIAHVGLYTHEAEEQGIELDTYTVPLHEINRAVTDGEDEGFVRIHARAGTGEIAGATIVAAHAGEMISEVTLAMVGDLSLQDILDTIHPYPTQAEGLKRAAGQWVRGRLTPGRQKLLGHWMNFRR